MTHETQDATVRRMSPQDPQPDQAPDLKPSEVATRLGVSTATIHRLIKAGTINAYRLGSQFRIPATEIERIRQTPA